jgi:CBS domain-containing protein
MNHNQQPNRKRRTAMKTLTVKDLMVKNPTVISPDATLQEAEEKMKSLDCGILPVGTKSKVTGMITDRDIVIRALSASKDPMEERVGDHMTSKVQFCKESDTVRQAATLMKKHGISRLLVKNGNGNSVTGILSFGRILREVDDIDEIAEAISGMKHRKAA